MLAALRRCGEQSTRAVLCSLYCTARKNSQLVAVTVSAWDISLPCVSAVPQQHARPTLRPSVKPQARLADASIPPAAASMRLGIRVCSVGPAATTHLFSRGALGNLVRYWQQQVSGSAQSRPPPSPSLGFALTVCRRATEGRFQRPATRPTTEDSRGPSQRAKMSEVGGRNPQTRDRRPAKRTRRQNEVALAPPKTQTLPADRRSGAMDGVRSREMTV